MLREAQSSTAWANFFWQSWETTMNHWKLILISAALLALATPTLAASKSGSEFTGNQSIWLGSGGSFNHWRPVSRDQFIIWASPSKPYLVKIWRPFTSLRFVHSIGVTSTTGRVTRFDNVIVDGQRLPIKSIVALDPETAKELRWRRK
jgi:hypothetical protein